MPELRGDGGSAPLPPLVLVVMGVSGSGKTTIATLLAQRLGWPFEDGDALHPAANIAKMHAGVPLTDADRAPWLRAVAAWIGDWLAAGQSGVVACSALKRAYRQAIAANRPNVRFVHLDGDAALIARRLAGRRGHFMPPALLASQFAALEPPTPDERPIVVSVDATPDRIVERIIAGLPPGAAGQSDRTRT